jgi:hypothetical protein
MSNDETFSHPVDGTAGVWRPTLDDTLLVK